jgi:hypothetical protein
MKPSDLTPYVWQRCLRIHGNDNCHRVEITTNWLKNQTPSSIWQALLEYEGIIGYHTELHNLHQHIFHPQEL